MEVGKESNVQRTGHIESQNSLSDWPQGQVEQPRGGIPSLSCARPPGARPSCGQLRAAESTELFRGSLEASVLRFTAPQSQQWPAVRVEVAGVAPLAWRPFPRPSTVAKWCVIGQWGSRGPRGAPQTAKPTACPAAATCRAPPGPRTCRRRPWIWQGCPEGRRGPAPHLSLPPPPPTVTAAAAARTPPPAGEL